MGFKVDFSNLEWGTVDNKLRGRPDDVERIQLQLEGLAAVIGGAVRVSRKGRLHLVVTRGNVNYSISKSSGNSWYVFYPFPSWGEDGHNMQFVNRTLLIEYFNRLLEEDEEYLANIAEEQL